MKKTILIMAMLMMSTVLFADTQSHPPATMPKEFDTLKTLVGTWEGKGTMEGKEQPVSVTYELTSGGTALVEKLMPGTPHEMVSVYHKEGKKLAMTHYCALGNAPVMALKKADAKQVSFEMEKSSGLTSPKEAHMHGVTLTWENPDQVTQEWTYYENGKKKDTSVFRFARKK